MPVASGRAYSPAHAITTPPQPGQGVHPGDSLGTGAVGVSMEGSSHESCTSGMQVPDMPHSADSHSPHACRLVHAMGGCKIERLLTYDAHAASFESLQLHAGRLVLSYATLPLRMQCICRFLCADHCAQLVKPAQLQVHLYRCSLLPSSRNLLSTDVLVCMY